MAGSPQEWADGAAVRLDRKDPYLRLQSITIFVRDLDRSLDFYSGQLGFQLVFDARSQQFAGRRFVTVAPPDGSANLTLFAPERDSEQYKFIGRHTQVTFVTEDVLAKFREWSARGVRFLVNPRLKRLKYPVHAQAASAAAPSSSGGEHPPIWGGVFARFRDPDGNSFSLVSFDEVTHAVEAERRAIAERLEAERRAAQELAIATQVQARLFPQTLPPLKTLEYAGICRQARQVGGDYYDFLDLGSERLGFVIGDTSGKGIAAALLMANLQANLRSQCAIAVDQPQRLLRSVNRLFCDNTTDGAFATLFFAEYNDATRGLRCDDSLARLEATATIVGVFKNWDCAISEIQISPGDIFALYTDGITESFNDAGEQFGEERLSAALCRHRALPSSDLLAAVVDEVHKFSPREQHDDITLIVGKSL